MQIKACFDVVFILKTQVVNYTFPTVECGLKGILLIPNSLFSPLSDAGTTLKLLPGLA